MRHPAPTDTLLASLYADAVLPCLADLLVLDPRAAKVAGSKPWQVALEIPGREPVRLAYADGGLVSAESAPGPLRLRFRSAQHFTRTCRGEARWPPLPVGGWAQLPRVGRFSALAKYLNEVMEIGAGAGEVRAQLLFGSLLVRALAVLCLGQPEAAALLRRFGATTFAFAIAGQALSWFRSTPSRRHYAGFAGAPPVPTTLTIDFESLDIACAAAEGRLDQFAAIGLGQVKVQGLTPLGDALDILLDRIDHYLQ